MVSNHPIIFSIGLSFILGLIFTALTIVIARSLGLVDLPGLRKIHCTPVPRIGGVAIGLTAIATFAMVTLVGRGFFTTAEHGQVITLIAAALCVLLVGLIDDLADLPARYKLVALVVAAGMFCGSGGLLDELTFHGRPVFHFGILAWPITILWMVGVAVSINFIDGLDGLAGGIVAIACAVAGFCAMRGDAPGMALIPMSLLGALLAFLVFNYHRAKVFMGDCGSLFIGFLLAGNGVLALKRVGSTGGVFLPAVALAIPLIDTLFTMVRRSILERRSVFAAERGHVHHRLLDVGLCQKHVVLLLHAVTFMGAGVAIIALLGNAWATAVTAVGFLIGLVVLFRMAGTMRARETLTAIRRNRAIRRESHSNQHAFEELQLGFREVRTFDLWWEQLCKATELLKFSKLDLSLTRRDTTTAILRWRSDQEALADSDSITAEVPIPQRRAGQTLRAIVEVRNGGFLECAGQRLALFSRLVSEHSPQTLPDDSEKPSFSEGAEVGSDQFPDPTHAEVGPAGRTPSHGILPSVRVAIVHDFLYTYAGAERVLEQIIRLFPQADLFSLFDFLPEELRGFINHKPVRTSFIQKLPLARRKHRAFLPLMPLAIEQLDVSNYDIVISSSYVVAKGVLTRPDQLHICYCHTPARFAWDVHYLNFGGRRGPLYLCKTIVTRLLLHYIRNWDVRSSNCVDAFLTNSKVVGQRVHKIYRRETTTVYPPVNTDWFTFSDQKEDFYVTASRLVPYKRIDLIIETFSRLPDRRLVVVGEGPELEKLRLAAPPNVRLVGYQSPERLRQYLQRARAFVFAAEEDFGIAPVEAQACGTPVIAFGRGGVTESVIPGQTGVLFDARTPESLMSAISTFESSTWDYSLIRQNAERFSIQQFRKQFAEITKAAWKSFLTTKRDTDTTDNRMSEILAIAKTATMANKPAMPLSGVTE